MVFITNTVATWIQHGTTTWIQSECDDFDENMGVGKRNPKAIDLCIRTKTSVILCALGIWHVYVAHEACLPTVFLFPSRYILVWKFNFAKNVETA